MKTLLISLLSVSALAANLWLASAEEPHPANPVDLGALTPSKSGGEFVEVNLNANLIGLAARLTEGQEPQVGKLLRGLKAIRVNVVGLDDSNRTQVLGQIERVRQQLQGGGWERVVTAQQKDQDVGVYLKVREATAVEGLVVTVVESGQQAVLVNIVGDIRPEQLAALGERFDIEPLKKIAPEKKP